PFSWRLQRRLRIISASFSRGQANLVRKEPALTHADSALCPCCDFQEPTDFSRSPRRQTCLSTCATAIRQGSVGSERRQGTTPRPRRRCPVAGPRARIGGPGFRNPPKTPQTQNLVEELRDHLSQSQSPRRRRGRAFPMEHPV